MPLKRNSKVTPRKISAINKIIIDRYKVGNKIAYAIGKPHQIPTKFHSV
jgi:hypothetical protein